MRKKLPYELSPTVTICHSCKQPIGDGEDKKHERECFSEDYEGTLSSTYRR